MPWFPSIAYNRLTVLNTSSRAILVGASGDRCASATWPSHSSQDDLFVSCIVSVWFCGILHRLTVFAAISHSATT